MRRTNLGRTLLACAAAVGASALMGGQAAAFVYYDPFVIYESPGVYDVVNNSTNLYIYSFQVSNTFAYPGGDATTRVGWTASTCGSCNGNNATNFDYFTGTIDPSTAAGLASLIGPGQSSNQFTFSAVLGSHYTIEAETAAGATETFTGGTTEGAPVSAAPEPSIWAMMIAGVAIVGAALRRRRFGAAAFGATA